MSFSFSLRQVPLTFSCKTGLVMLNSFSFHLSAKLLFSLLNLRESLAGKSTLGCRFFFFVTLFIYFELIILGYS